MKLQFLNFRIQRTKEEKMQSNPNVIAVIAGYCNA